MPCCAGSTHPSATLSNQELLDTLSWVSLWENGKGKAGKGGKQHSGCCRQSQASPLASAGLCRLKGGEACSWHRWCSYWCSFSKHWTQHKITLQKQTRDCPPTEPGWTIPLKVVNEDEMLTPAVKFLHLNCFSVISSLGFMGKKKSALRSKQNFIPQHWLVLIQIPSGFFPQVPLRITVLWATEEAVSTVSSGAVNGSDLFGNTNVPSARCIKSPLLD